LADDENQVTCVIRYIANSLHRIHDSTIQRFNDSTRRSHSSFRAQGAVTIIELLVVMMIIFILAGLILATSNYVQNKGARSRAETEIAAMSAALESYKADNGIYPFTAQTNSLTSATTDPASYKTASLDFYKLISGDGDANGAADTGQKSYFTFKPQMLGGTRDANGNITAVQYVRDPFGNSYGYSTSKTRWLIPRVTPRPSATIQPSIFGVPVDR
jgi:type II secretory pathway pseudopilin PulG